MPELLEDESVILAWLEQLETENKNSIEWLQKVEKDAFDIKSWLEDSLKKLNDESN